MSLNVCPQSVLGWTNKSALGNFSRKNPALAGVVLLVWWLWVSHYHSSHFPSIGLVRLNYRALIFSGPNRSSLRRPFPMMAGSAVLSVIQICLETRSTLFRWVLESVLCSCALYLEKVLEIFPFDSHKCVTLNALLFARWSYNNNNNNIYLLQLVCHPVAVVILHVYKMWNWLLPNLSLEGYMRSV